MVASPRLALVPGSFDPLTNGHVDVVRRAARLFDVVVVAVLRNTGKQPLFSVEERVAMIRATFADVPGIEADAFDGLLVDYARRRGAVAIVRGLRGVGDFDHEQQMTRMNRHLDANIDTVLLLPSTDVVHIGSTLVREIAAMGGSIAGLVPPAVEQQFERRRQAATRRRV
jgi:pantetheine-phosphate adenylyltransferase